MSSEPAEERGGVVDLGRLKRNRLKREEARSVVEELTAPVVVPETVVTEPVTGPPAVAAAPVAAEVPVAAGVTPPAAVSVPVAAPVAVQQPAVTPAPVAPVVEEPLKEKPIKNGFFQSKDQGDRMRRTYSDTRPMTQHATLSDFICYAVEQYCSQLEEEFNDGQQYTSDPGQVRRGRPVGR